jgi:RNA polymerase sigma-70 factor, ECF subfamily
MSSNSVRPSPKEGPEPNTDDDRVSALVDAARHGSSDAFGELVDRYRAPVVRLAYSLTRDVDEAKDIAQDAFLRAYRRIDSFRPDRPFARWLFVIARNASLDAIRRRQRAAAQLPTVEAEVEDPQEHAMRNEDAENVRLALRDLPEHYRTVLEMYYVSGLRYREIAVALGIPIGTVKTYIARGKRRLRDLLGPGMQAAA